MEELPLSPFINTPYSDPIFPGVEVPAANPQDFPKTCFEFNIEYQPIVTALLRRLTIDNAWLGTEEEKLLGIAKADTLINILQQEECSDKVPEDGCTEFLPETPFAQFYPNNPYTSPDYVPPGYVLPPWYTNPLVRPPGVIPTDAMVNFLSLALGQNIADLVASGLPRCRLNFTGVGEIEITLVKVPQGGQAMLIFDDNLTTVQFKNLNAFSILDVSSVLGLLGIILGSISNEEEVVEYKFATIGDHHVDITFLPNVSEEEIIGFGGGIRRWESCSHDLAGDTNYMPITDIRVNEETCKWQVQYNDDGIWVNVGDYWLPGCAVIPDAPVPTVVRSNPAGFGDMQQNIDGAGYTDIAASDYVRRDGLYPMTGGLEIYPTTSETPLTIQPAVTPATAYYDIKRPNGNRIAQITNANLFEMSDDAGNRKMWLDPINKTIVMFNGGINRIHASNNYLTYLKIQVNSSNNMTMWEGAKTGFGNEITHDEASQVSIENIDTGNVTLRLKAKSTQALDMLRSQDSAGIRRAAIASDHSALFMNQILLQGNSTTQPRETALWQAVWEDATDATRKSKFTISAFDTSAREVISGKAYTGGVPAIGFLGATPQPRLTLTGDIAGNEALTNLATILEQFGLIVDSTTDSGVPGGGVTDPCALDRCAYADVTAQWLARELWYRVGFVGGRFDLTSDLYDREASARSEVDIGFADFDQLDLFVAHMGSDYAGSLDSTNAELIAFLLDGMAYIQTTVAQRLYCVMDDCGFVSPGNFAIWINSISPGSDLETRVKELLLAIDVNGLATMITLAAHSQYRANITLDCTEIDCAGWSHFYPFTDQDFAPEVFSLIVGSYTASGYESFDEGDCRIEEAFHTLYAQMTVRTEDDTPPLDIYFVNLDTNAETHFTPHSGSNDVEWSGDSATGLALVLVAPTGLNAHIVHASITGIGTEPSL